MDKLKSLLFMSSISRKSIMDSINHNCMIDRISKHDNGLVVFNLLKITNHREFVIYVDDDEIRIMESGKIANSPHYYLDNQELVSLLSRLSPTTRRNLYQFIESDKLEAEKMPHKKTNIDEAEAFYE